jgi:hypothetical protein
MARASWQRAVIRESDALLRARLGVFQLRGKICPPYLKSLLARECQSTRHAALLSSRSPDACAADREAALNASAPWNAILTTADDTTSGSWATTHRGRRRFDRRPATPTGRGLAGYRCIPMTKSLAQEKGFYIKVYPVSCQRTWNCRAVWEGLRSRSSVSLLHLWRAVLAFLLRATPTRATAATCLPHARPPWRIVSMQASSKCQAGRRTGRGNAPGYPCMPGDLACGNGPRRAALSPREIVCLDQNPRSASALPTATRL